jgi:hypothetical protein
MVVSAWESHQALILSALSASIKLLLMFILGSWVKYWRKEESHGVMFTIWMRKDVSEVEAEECSLLNFSYHAQGVHITSCEVRILNSPQLSNACAQMALTSHLVSSSLGNNSMKSGLLIFLMEFGEFYYQILIYIN